MARHVVKPAYSGSWPGNQEASGCFYMVIQTDPVMSAGPSSVSTHVRVLVVEDHPDTLYALKSFLQHKGHVVHAAVSAEAALRVPRSDYDAAIIDILHPRGMNGCELLKALVERDGPLQAIAFSVAGSAEDVARCREAGFFRHVLKPGLDELMAALADMTADFSQN